MGKDEKTELGKTIVEAMEKYGNGNNGKGATILCLKREKGKELLGSKDEIREALNEVGVSDVEVEDVEHKTGKKLICIAVDTKQLKNSKK